VAQCTAHSKRSGKRCRSNAIVGGNVCHLHGGATRQAKAKAAVRATLQQLLREMPARPWHEVYSEALHVNDVMMRHYRNKVENGETLDPAELDQLQQASGRAAMLAKGVHDIGTVDASLRQQQVATSVIVAVLGRTIDDMVNALALPAASEGDLRQWIHERVHAELLAYGEERPPRSALPAPPAIRAPAPGPADPDQPSDDARSSSAPSFDPAPWRSTVDVARPRPGRRDDPAPPAPAVRPLAEPADRPAQDLRARHGEPRRHDLDERRLP